MVVEAYGAWGTEACCYIVALNVPDLASNA